MSNHQNTFTQIKVMYAIKVNANAKAGYFCCFCGWGWQKRFIYEQDGLT
jgi:hypothetical protein